MPSAQRQGDANTAGGIATSGESTVRVNGRAVVVPGVSVTPHPCFPSSGCSKHGSASTAGGSSTVRAGGKNIIRSTADTDTCGHPRSGGSPDVRVA
jgi:uncharacterized Zn-binding protein involved in type VI secretion